MSENDNIIMCNLIACLFYCLTGSSYWFQIHKIEIPRANSCCEKDSGYWRISCTIFRVNIC